MNVLICCVTFIRMFKGKRGGGRHGRPRWQEVPLPDDIPVQEEGVGQANIAEPASQQAMDALARQMAGALRESMDILRAKNQVQAHTVEAGSFFLKREFFQSN